MKQQLDGFDKATRTPKADFLYIDWSLAKKLVAFSYSRDRVEQAILYAVSAAVMPRLKNELLPLCWNRLDQHSRVVFDPENRHVKILLKSRKNRPEGDEIVRPLLVQGREAPIVRGSRVDQLSKFSAIPGRLLWRNIFNIIHHVSSATASRSESVRGAQFCEVRHESIPAGHRA